MKLIFLLSTAACLISAVPRQHGFATFMPQDAINVSIDDTLKSKEKTIVIIKTIDGKNNEKEIIHEFRDFESIPDSIRAMLKEGLVFDHAPFHMDTVFKKFHLKLKHSVPELEDLVHEKIIHKIPDITHQMQMLDHDMELFERRLSNNFGHKNFEIVDADNEGVNSKHILKLDRFAYYPNPNHGNLTIEFSAQPKKSIAIKIYDLIGRVWYEESILNFEGDYLKNLPIRFSSGVYMLKIEQEGKVLAKKIVVE